MSEKDKKTHNEIQSDKKQVNIFVQGNAPQFTNLDFLRLIEAENRTLWDSVVSIGVFAIESGLSDKLFGILENAIKNQPDAQNTITNLLAGIFVASRPKRRERILNILQGWNRQKDEQLSLWSSRTKDEIINLVTTNTTKEYLTFTFDENLTPKVLSEILSPFLLAVNHLQQIIGGLKETPEKEIVIRQIAQFSPVSVSLEGASDAIEVIKNTIVPWRRDHVQKMLRLSEQEKSVEIERIKAEVLEIRAKAQREKAEKDKLIAESKSQLVQVEKSLLEIKKEKLAIQQSKIQLALNIIRELAPNLSETEKIRYLAELLQVLNNLIDSPVELK